MDYQMMRDRIDSLEKRCEELEHTLKDQERENEKLLDMKFSGDKLAIDNLQLSYRNEALEKEIVSLKSETSRLEEANALLRKVKEAGNK
jgi:chromosome segregation ATPase